MYPGLQAAEILGTARRGGPEAELSLESQPMLGVHLAGREDAVYAEALVSGFYWLLVFSNPALKKLPEVVV